MRLYELTESIVTEGSEKFNDEVMRPGFRWSEEINGITYLVRTRWDNMPEVMARVNNREVGRATFIDHQTRSGLESVSTYVSPKWQGHGIAKNMYAVMRMLGANIQPSATQTAMGKDMWAKWKKSGDTKHLTSMNAKMNTKDVAEDLNSQFDIIEAWIEELAEQHGVDPEVIWEDFEAVDDDTLLETAAWQKKSGKNKNGGLNKKGVASYRREHPGSKLQTAVTTKPSKLKKGSKAAKRRKSFCARMGGSKGPMKDDNGKPTRKALALRKWNC